jgi:hypothetical protein
VYWYGEQEICPVFCDIHGRREYNLMTSTWDKIKQHLAIFHVEDDRIFTAVEQPPGTAYGKLYVWGAGGVRVVTDYKRVELTFSISCVEKDLYRVAKTSAHLQRHMQKLRSALEESGAQLTAGYTGCEQTNIEIDGDVVPGYRVEAMFSFIELLDS